MVYGENTDLEHQRDELIRRRGNRMAIGVAVGAFLSTFVGAGMFVSCTGLYLLPLAEGMGENVAVVSLMYTFMTVSGSVLSLFYYKIEHRFTLRKMMGAGVICLSASFAILAFAKDVMPVYLAGMLTGVATVFTGHVLVQDAITRWFAKKRSMVNSIVISGGSLVGIVISPAVTAVLTSSNYQAASLMLAALSLGCGIISVALMRDNPTKYHVMPYGAEIKHSSEGTSGADLVAYKMKGMSMKEALKRWQCWAIFGGYLVLEMIWRGVGSQNTTVFLSKGFSYDEALVFVMVFYLATTVFRLVCGVIIGKLGPVKVISIYGTMAVAAFVVCTLSDSFMATMVYAIGSAFVGGIIGIYGIVCITRVFGPREAADINGIASVFFNIGGAIGPVVLSGIYVATGSYSTGFGIFAALMVVFVGISAAACRKKYAGD